MLATKIGIVKYGFRVPAGFSFELGPSRAWARFQNSGSNTPKSSKKRRARVGLGPRPAPPLIYSEVVVDPNNPVISTEPEPNQNTTYINTIFF